MGTKNLAHSGALILQTPEGVSGPLQSQGEQKAIKNLRQTTNHRNSGKPSREQSVGHTSIIPHDSGKLELAGQDGNSEKSDEDKTPGAVRTSGPKSSYASGMGLSAYGQRNILDRLGNNYTFQRVKEVNGTAGSSGNSLGQGNVNGTNDLKDSDDLNSRTDGLEDKQLNFKQKDANKNPSAFLLEDMKKKKMEFMNSYARRNVTNWWQENRGENANGVEENDDDEGYFDHNKSMNHKPSHRAKTVIQTHPQTEDPLKKYHISKNIGKGSYATVEKVSRRTDFVTFAMKCMTLEDIATKTHRYFPNNSHEEQLEVARVLCENEINISKAIDGHPNISTIEDHYFDKAEGKYHLYSLFADYGCLLSEEHIKYISKINNGSKELTMCQKKDLFRQIASGIRHMHSRNIVHRDIKKDNILVFKGGIPKITDYSVSLEVDKPIKILLRVGTTKIYQPPEVWEDCNYLGFPHDIWSLGVVLWEMIFHTMPFKSTTEIALKQEILAFKPVFPQVELDPDLKEVLEGTLTRDPTQRWSVEQVTDCAWLNRPSSPTKIESLTTS